MFKLSPQHTPFIRSTGRFAAASVLAAALAVASLAGCSSDAKLADPTPTAKASSHDVVHTFVTVGSNALKVAAPEDASGGVNHNAYWLENTTLPGGGHPIQRYNIPSATLTLMPALPNGEGAVDISSNIVGLYAVSNTGSVYKWEFWTPTWIQMPFPGLAKTIDAYGGRTTPNTSDYYGGIVVSTPSPTNPLNQDIYSYGYASDTFVKRGEMSFLTSVTMGAFGQQLAAVNNYTGDFTGYQTWTQALHTGNQWAPMQFNGTPAKGAMQFAFGLSTYARITARKRPSADGYLVMTIKPFDPAPVWESQQVDAIQVDMDVWDHPWIVTAQGEVKYGM